ncbi:MAG TPA: hypothetical protein PKI14_19320 [Fervidobacterium sp.]|nr:hypothetical protein [Fervidobacterium sp.]
MKKQLKLPVGLKNTFLYQAQKRGQNYKNMLEQGVQQNLQFLYKISQNSNRKTKKVWQPVVEIDENMLRECANNLGLSANCVLTIAAIMSLVPTIFEREIIDFGAILQEVTDYVDSHEEFLSDDFGRDGNITLFFIKRCVQELIQKYPDADEDTFLAIYNSIVPPPYDYTKHWDIALAYYRKLKQN